MPTSKNKTDATRRRGNPIPAATKANNPNLVKRGVVPPPSDIEATLAGHRDAYGRRTAELDGQVSGPAASTPSMARRRRSGDSSMPRPDGGVGGAVMD